jgi:hypothetical protein
MRANFCEHHNIKFHENPFSRSRVINGKMGMAKLKLAYFTTLSLQKRPLPPPQKKITKPTTLGNTAYSG